MNTNASGKTKKDWLAFCRADYFAAKIILGVAVVGSVMSGLVQPVVNGATGAPLPVAYITKVTSSIDLPRGATHDGVATLELLLNDATMGERFTQALPGLVFAGVTISVAWLLFQLLRSTQSGEPFTRRNVRRINTIALVVGAGGILAQYAGGFADSMVVITRDLPDTPSLFFGFSFSPVPLVAMLAIALVGEVFRRGVALRDDVEGLV
jgi:Protein of unknown function (DUF2975)